MRSSAAAVLALLAGLWLALCWLPAHDRAVRREAALAETSADLERARAHRAAEERARAEADRRAEEREARWRQASQEAAARMRRAETRLESLRAVLREGPPTEGHPLTPLLALSDTAREACRSGWGACEATVGELRARLARRDTSLRELERLLARTDSLARAAQRARPRAPARLAAMLPYLAAAFALGVVIR